MKQPWIYSARVDGSFILAPALAIVAIVLLFKSTIAAITDIPIWMWGVLIVGVDVAHVYSTLFRTYADHDEFKARRTLYIVTPLACWAAGALLYTIGESVFWRAIAYLAVFHFVRQQYGFMMIYARRERHYTGVARHIDAAAIYMATLYPIIYWHTHLPRHFVWFMEGDFIAVPSHWLDRIGFACYLIVMVAYTGKELAISARQRIVNIPKNILLFGTAWSWWVGIIVFNNDLAFTALNVLAHGIPYMALIWIYGNNQAAIEPNKRIFRRWSLQQFFSWGMIPVFALILVGLAYFEEGLWDGLVWTEHRDLFAPFQFLPPIDSKETLAWLIPLLALPQLTHYALDGFIWRLKTPGTNWRQILFYRERTA